MKPELYSKNLKNRNGLPKAQYISEMNMKNTLPNNWNSVTDKEGNSNIFTTSKNPNKFEKDKINLYKCHEFWKHVYYILKKQKS